MAVRKNNSQDELRLRELRSWWDGRREMLAAEYFSQFRDRGVVGVELFSFDTGDGRKDSLHLELHEGIPLLVIRDGESRKMRSFMGDSLGSPRSVIDGYAKDPSLVPVGTAKELYFLEQVFENYSHVSALFQEAVSRDENAYYEKKGLDRRQMIVDAVCGNVILDDGIVNPSHMYYHTRNMSVGEIESIREEVWKTSESFLKEMSSEGYLTRKDYAELLSFSRKGISDLFHPWTLLKGRLDCQLSNLGWLRGECTAKDIAKVVTWAERTPAFASYVGRELEEWSKLEADHFRVRFSDVQAERRKIPGSLVTEKKRRPELSGVAKAKIRNRFM